MTSPGYRAEVLCGDLIQYILNGKLLSTSGEYLLMNSVLEYEKAATLLGSLSDDWPGSQYMRESSPIRSVTSNVLGDLPIVSYMLLLTRLYS